MADSSFIKTQRDIRNRQSLRHQVFRHHSLVYRQTAFHEGFIQIAFQVILSGDHGQQERGIAHVAFLLGGLHGEFAKQISLVGAGAQGTHHGIVNPANGVFVAGKTIAFAQGGVFDLFIVMGQLRWNGIEDRLCLRHIPLGIFGNIFPINLNSRVN